MDKDRIGYGQQMELMELTKLAVSLMHHGLSSQDAVVKVMQTYNRMDCVLEMRRRVPPRDRGTIGDIQEILLLPTSRPDNV